MIRRNILFASVAASALVATGASAQVTTRDHRRPVRPAPPPAATVQSFGPAVGPAGTVVTIRGKDLPARATIFVGGVQVAPTRATGEALTFAVPDLKPGNHDIEIRLRRRVVAKVGAFRLMPERERDRDRDHRDRHADRGRDNRDHDRGRDNRDPDRGRDHDRGRDGHRWRIDRAVVSSYAPRAGKPGSRVVIHGDNFADGTVVLYGDREITPERIGQRQIVFTVPRGRRAADATIALRVPGMRRALAVGSFEITQRDFETERRRRDAERRRRAEQRWKEQQRELAKDRAARVRAMHERERELRESRERRRSERVRGMRARWKRAFLADPDTVAELTLHGQRTARLDRMRRLAVANAHGKLVIRIDVLLDRENDRHERRMAALQASFTPTANR